MIDEMIEKVAVTSLSLPWSTQSQQLIPIRTMDDSGTPMEGVHLLSRTVYQ